MQKEDTDIPCGVAKPEVALLEEGLKKEEDEEALKDIDEEALKDEDGGEASEKDEGVEDLKQD